ncbi:FdhF/YdeP family oxidoreductase [Synoicihabitans lomoniglobus]|uniref:FdhF/YdeP family oxidoreductase n=1 Tax=Synoicihabitans lomoniglobus TaxID=2909285 RepID=A0AAF0CPL1_9BACT|nr:FdhF/YdeP family oxidoreductase [Opitutaceae bacterium LMO-M01]WED65314.1 FdhF/YdeP family oxidoreductase [Opitutaceae bacterium LMO-M01]
MSCPRPTFGQRLARLSPFGIGHTKPKHFRDMLKVVWSNRDNLPYAWKILTRGVCDGCALGVAGLHDWTIKGTHLCMTRLNLLRLNTMPAMAPDALADVASLPRDNRDLRALGRLAYPLRRRKGEPGFTRISWDDALASIGQKIRATTPDRLAFFVTSRGVTNEIYYLAQKAARYLGTNHVDNAARLCHSPSTAAMKQTLGISASTCGYSDWFGTDVIVFFGSNPANDQPVSTKYLHLAKKRGTKIIIVNPYLEPGMQRYWVPSNLDSALFGSDLCDDWYAVSQGGDIAFLYGVIKHLDAAGLTDTTFLAEHTTGWEDIVTRARTLDWPLLEQAAGLPAGRMIAFAELIGHAKTGVFVWSMGITQHPWGADGVRMVLNTALARGFIGRDQCGVMPIRGHSSVQGGAEMGAYATAFPGGLAVNETNAANLTAHYGFEIPAWEGLAATEMVEACHRGELDVFHMVGGNFLRTLPDPDYVAEALQRVPLRIHQDIIVTDQMLLDPSDEVILLPAQTRYEQDDGGTETSTERRVMFTPEIPREVGETRAEWKILRDIALAAKPDPAGVFGCTTGQAVREEIARVVPFYDGVQHLRKTGDAFQYGGPHLCPGGVCPTSDGKAHLATIDLPPVGGRPDHVFHVSTRRGKQFNTLIYAEIDPLNNAPRDAVLMNADDAAKRHLKQGDTVTLHNPLGRYNARVHLAPIAPGNLQIHWPEGNHLIDRTRKDAGGGVPDYNALVELETA